MRYSPRHYARAFSELINSGRATADVCRHGLLKIVRKNGDSYYLDKIALEIEKELVHQAGGRVIEVETARPLSAAAREKTGSILQAQDLRRDRLNPALIAGLRITIDGEREFDWSLAKKMRKLFT